MQARLRPLAVQHRLDLGLVLVSGVEIRVERQRGRYGAGGWLLICPHCCRAVRKLHAARAPWVVAAPWACRLCVGVAYANPYAPLHKLELQIARGEQPRRTGEPPWRRRRRVALAKAARIQLEQLLAAETDSETRAAERLGLALGIDREPDAD